MNNKEIGIATMRYKRTGEVLSAVFIPTMISNTEIDFLKNLQGNLTKEENAEQIAHNAETALASFSTEIDSITLADREKQQIVSIPHKCVYYEDGNIKKCVVKFILKDVTHDVIQLQS